MVTRTGSARPARKDITRVAGTLFRVGDVNIADKEKVLYAGVMERTILFVATARKVVLSVQIK